MHLEATKICRTCLGLEVKLLSIYQTKGFSNTGYVSDMLTKLTNIPPDISDGFPGNVCLECIREISRCYSFKLRCEHSYSTLKQILLENIVEPQIESKEEPNIKKSKPNSNVKILSQTVISSPSNIFNLISSEKIENKTDIAKSVVCKNNQSKKTNNMAVPPEKEEHNNMIVDPFEMMITKMVFEDDTDCLDFPKSWLSCKTKESEFERNKSTAVIKIEPNPSPHKLQPLLKPEVANNDSTNVNHTNHSKISDYQVEVQKRKIIEKESNAKNEALLSTSSPVNPIEDRNEYQIHLSCESLDFKSDITIRNSPKKKESSFPCPTCGKVFTLISSLHNHKLIHSEERPFSCQYCEKTFRNKSTHKLHELRHKKNKPFQCDECKNTFVCLKELNTHLLVHKNEYPYVCEFCSKKFRYANSLKSHIRIHTGEKPYVCIHCSKRYAQLASLVSHHKRHIDKGLIVKEINECKYCKKLLNKKKQKLN